MDRKPKIVQAVHAFPPQIGGIETHVESISIAMAKQGADVVVHTAACTGSRSHDEKLAKVGVRVKRHFSVKLPFFSSVVIIPGMALHLLLEGGDAYFSHGFGSIVPFCASIAAKLRGKQFFWTIHGMPKFSGAKQAFVYAYSAVFGFVPMLLSDKIVCVSRAVVDALPKYASRKKVRIIPNGVREEFLAEGKKPRRARKKFTVLYAGRLDRSKGVWMLLDAFEEFHSRHKESELMYVGPDEGEGEGLKAEAAKRGLPVKFLKAALKDMPGIYSSASLTVLPSEYEGFGLSVFESWACGTPAISTRVGASPEFFESAFGKEAGSFLFNGKDSLVSRMDAVYSANDAKKNIWAGKARSALAGYSWSVVAKKSLLLLQ